MPHLSPCIMCVQYRGGCSVPWGMFSTVGDVQYRGGNHEYRGGYLEYSGGYHDKCGNILSTVGVFSTMGDIMSTVGGGGTFVI